MRYLSATAFVFACAVVAGCGLNRYEVPTSILALAESDLALEIDWRVGVGVDAEILGSDAYERGGVAVDAGLTRVVATTSRGTVVSVDAVTGELRWEIEVASEPFAAPPAIHAGIVYVAGPDGVLRALRLESGGEVWNRPLNDVFNSAPAVVGTNVVVNSATGKVWAVDRTTGRQVWSFERRLRSALTIAGGGQAVGTGNLVLAGFPDGTLAAIRPDGNAEWLADLASGEDRLRDVDTTPLLADGAAYAASFSGGLHRVELATGAITWRVELEGATSPLAVGDYLVTTTADGLIVWLDPATGELAYELEMDGDDCGALVRWGDYLFMAEQHDGLFVIAASRPWIHARFAPDSGFSSPPVVGGGRIWALSNGGVLYGVRMVPLR